MFLKFKMFRKTIVFTILGCCAYSISPINPNLPTIPASSPGLGGAKMSATLNIPYAITLQISNDISWSGIFGCCVLDEEINSSRASITSIVSSSSLNGQNVQVFGAVADDVDLQKNRFQLHSSTGHTIPFELHVEFLPANPSIQQDVTIPPGGRIIDVTSAPNDTTFTVIYGKIKGGFIPVAGKYKCNLIFKNYLGL